MNDTVKLYTGPTITIFVRHSAKCQFKDDSQYKRCNCWKHVRWFDGKKPVARNTGSRTWDGAERVKRAKEIELDPQHAPVTERPKEATIAEVIKTFVLSKKGQNLGHATIRKWEYLLGCFDGFMAQRSVFYFSKVTQSEMVSFRHTWAKNWGSGVTRQKAQQNFRGFLRFACQDFQHFKLLTETLQPIKLTRVDKDRLAPKPYTEAEILALLKQIPVTFADDPDIITLMTAWVHCQVATGLAISDMVLLHRREIADGWLRIRRHKTDRPVRQRLDPSLHQELMGLADKSSDQRVFWHTDVIATGAAQYSLYLKAIMEAAGLYVKGNLSHRFRDTAVDFWLGEGWTLTDVADALGDTVAVVERHYKDMASRRAEERIAALPVRRWA